MVIFDSRVGLPDGIFSGKKQHVFRSIFFRNNILIHKKHLDTAGFREPFRSTSWRCHGSMAPGWFGATDICWRWIKNLGTAPKRTKHDQVGGLKHICFHIFGIIIPTDFHIFFRGVDTPPTLWFKARLGMNPIRLGRFVEGIQLCLYSKLQTIL